MTAQHVPDHARLEHADERIAAKLVAGEVILVDLQDGTYWSVQGTGARAWAELTAGQTVEETTARLVELHGADHAVVAQGVQNFLAAALTDGLLRPASTGRWLDHADEDLPEVGAWEEPLVERFDDMNDLLALDPPMPNLTDLNWGGPAST